MINKKRQFSMLKLESEYIIAFNYHIVLNYHLALKYDKIIRMADGQLLRSIRDITNKKVDICEVNELYAKRDLLIKKQNQDDVLQQIREIQRQIDDILFIPEYISVIMKNKTEYNKIYKHGFSVDFNGISREYVRIDCGAGKARKKTVDFCSKDIYDELTKRLSNGMPADYKIAPSKFNAYFGLYSSASTVVSTPKFCVVEDYENNIDVKVNYVTETTKNEDDIVEEKIINLPFNRSDGMGIISPHLANIWAKDLGLDYIPAEFCLRQSFMKGMVCVFPYKEFCEENAIWETTDVWGNKVDLHDVDLILTKSQFKLWDAYANQAEYEKNLQKNDLKWGVSLFTPKKDKNLLKMNYQFLQTLHMSDEDIVDMCSPFVQWLKSSTYNDINSVLLFLLGSDNSIDNIQNFMQSSDRWWLKALVLDHNLIHDKFIKQKIYTLIKTKIQNGCLGQIYINGNFQVLVSDPYALMQHVCGLKVTGLLRYKEFYSNYWNEKNVKTIDTMRAPLTYRSEHVIMPLKKNEETEKWYRYLYTGLILNYFGEETIRLGGSDFDYDIGASTDCQQVIDGVYQNELPTYYTPNKPKKIVLSDKKLYQADTFSFGQTIGTITNNGSSCFALLDNFSKDSKEYATILTRLKTLPKYQNAQIDKSKIGKTVKEIPKCWTKKTDDNFLNSILVDKKPYFFIYLYNATKKEYKAHCVRYNNECYDVLGYPLAELLAKNKLNKKEQEIKNRFIQYSPVIDSNSIMNRLCHYIESIKDEILQEVKK